MGLKGVETSIGLLVQDALCTNGLSGYSELRVQCQEETAEEERKDGQPMAETHPEEAEEE